MGILFLKGWGCGPSGERDTGNRACEQRQAGNPACARWLAASPSFLSAPPVGTGVPPVLGRSGGRKTRRGAARPRADKATPFPRARQCLCHPWLGAHPRKNISRQDRQARQEHRCGASSPSSLSSGAGLSSRSSPRRPAPVCMKSFVGRCWGHPFEKG